MAETFPISNTTLLDLFDGLVGIAFEGGLEFRLDCSPEASLGPMNSFSLFEMLLGGLK